MGDESSGELINSLLHCRRIALKELFARSKEFPVHASIPNPAYLTVDLRVVMNLYAYVFDNPSNTIDPFGLASGDWWDPQSYKIPYGQKLKRIARP